MTKQSKGMEERFEKFTDDRINWDDSSGLDYKKVRSFIHKEIKRAYDKGYKSNIKKAQTTEGAYITAIKETLGQKGLDKIMYKLSNSIKEE